MEAALCVHKLTEIPKYKRSKSDMIKEYKPESDQD